MLNLKFGAYVRKNSNVISAQSGSHVLRFAAAVVDLPAHEAPIMAMAQLSTAITLLWRLEQITEDGYQIACTYGLAAVDALHVAAALWLKASELVTTEKMTKPIHRVTEIKIISI